MGIDYIEYAKIFKVFSDPKRLKIINMLSNGELCACKILEEFQNREKMNEIYKTVGKLMIPDGFSNIVDCDCEKDR